MKKGDVVSLKQEITFDITGKDELCFEKGTFGLILLDGSDWVTVKLRISNTVCLIRRIPVEYLKIEKFNVW